MSNTEAEPTPAPTASPAHSSRGSAIVLPLLTIALAALVIGVSAYSNRDTTTAAASATTDGATSQSDGSITSTTHDHGTAAAIAPKPYDPENSDEVDLSGVEGVTPAQQAAAENLIKITLNDLPHFADPATAEAEGFYSIKDGFTGVEHYINWNYINDEYVLDPRYPESLVYDTTGPERKLVSAMYMTSTGTTLEDVPELGGKLTQWHVHDNLCFTDAGGAPRIAGVTNGEGKCPGALTKFTPVPMIHVWITSHPCGPFAALEGVGAGQIKNGETRLCDEAHGS